jgi:protein tyrosine kinase modulator
MEEQEYIKGIQDYIGVFKRNKKLMIVIAVILFAITCLITFKLPSVYRAEAIILIEQQDIPQDLVRSTVTSYADQRIHVISQRVMSSVNLKKIVEKFNLFVEEQKKESFTSILNKMRDDIQLEMISADVIDPRSGAPMKATIAFSLSFSSTDPVKAQQVTNELVSLYLNENLKQRSEAAAETTSFLSMEAGKLREQITDLESQLAVFKEENAFSLPELQGLNLQMFNRTEQQIMELERQIRVLNDRKVYIQAELVQLSPNADIYTAKGERIYSTEARLKSKQAEYIALSAKYGVNHPDLVSLRKTISALEQEVGGVDKSEYQLQLKDKQAELAILEERYSSEHPDVKKLKQQISSLQKELIKPVRRKKVIKSAHPDNPAYIQLETQLATINSELRGLRSSKEKLNAKLSSYEQRLTKTPQVEREYQMLVRDYENAKQKYREVTDKQMEADMAQAMEKDRKGERFSLIEAPLLPDKPYKPNRLLLIILGFILSIAASTGFVILRESMNHAVYGSKKITALTSAAPLVVIPYITTKEEEIKQQQMHRYMIYSTLGLSVVAILMFHYFIKPLDVLWYVLLRQAGFN